MATPANCNSVYELQPLELGAIEARDGFSLQDQVAAAFCIELLFPSDLDEVWCETLDDITLIHKEGSTVIAEFVQVKGSDLGQHWTIAKLCEKKDGAPCIFERSLAQDRCSEAVRFRIVTTQSVTNELKILAFPLGAPGREGENGTLSFKKLHESMQPRVGSCVSPNGHGYKYWTERAHWHVCHSEQSVRDANILRLQRALQDRDIFLAVDQLEEIYTKLLKKVWDASRANPLISVAEKRITKAAMEQWLETSASALALPSAGADDLVRKKMESAGLPEDMILSALDQRRRYRHEQLSQKYLSLTHQRSIEGEVTAVLQVLKSQLDNGQLPDDGSSFHAVCLEQIELLRKELVPSPPRAFVQGCMYSIAGRCLHRFRRVTA